MIRDPDSLPKKKHEFPTTRWTLVLASDSPDAFDRLCARYWVPIYAFLRNRGYQKEDAEDLVQGFLEKMARRGALVTADAEKGKFRTFLLTALVRFSAQERRKATAQKRGGGVAHVEFDEELTGRWTGGEGDPRIVFDRAWALAIFRGVLAKLEKEADKKGRGEEFALIKPHLVGAQERASVAVIAAEFGLAANTAKMRVARARTRFRERMREAVAETLDAPTDAEIDEELRYLVAVLQGDPGSAL